MKELPIEEKAKRYDEAIEKAKSMIDDLRKGEDILSVSNLESMFPELKESEESKDERIRKEIIAFLHSKNGYMTPNEDWDFHNRWLAWLEKQGEQLSAIRWYDVSLIPQEMEELLVEWDSEDATWHEIAFYHADTKTFWNGTRQVVGVTRWCYIIDLLEKQGEQKSAKNILEAWKDMRLEVYQQASGNRHEPNYSDDTTKMFSLNDIDEIIEKMSKQPSKAQ